MMLLKQQQQLNADKSIMEQSKQMVQRLDSLDEVLTLFTEPRIDKETLLLKKNLVLFEEQMKHIEEEKKIREEEEKISELHDKLVLMENQLTKVINNSSTTN